MDITLRKAKQIQQAINEAINSIPLQSNVQITEYDDPISVIGKTRETLTDNLFKKNALISALYKIRLMVGNKNATSGLDDKLTLIAETQAKQDVFSNLMNSGIQQDMKMVLGMHEKIKAMPAVDQYGRVQTQVFSSFVVDQDTIDLYKAKHKELQALKVSLQDEVLELNLRTKIKLDAATVKTLKEAGVL